MIGDRAQGWGAQRCGKDDSRPAIVGRLRAEAEEVAGRFARQLHETHPLYRGVDDPELLRRSRDAAIGAITTFAAWVERGTRSFDPDELAYLTQQAADSAAQLFPLEALLEPLGLGVHALWEWIVNACDDAGTPPGVALDLVEELTYFQVELQRVLTAAYVQSRFQPDDEERQAQHELLELLLA